MRVPKIKLSKPACALKTSRITNSRSSEARRATRATVHFEFIGAPNTIAFCTALVVRQYQKFPLGGSADVAWPAVRGNSPPIGEGILRAEDCCVQASDSKRQVTLYSLECFRIR